MQTNQTPLSRRDDVVRGRHHSLTTTMTSDSAKGPPKGGMSLYANLLGDSTDAPGTISRAPVVFKQTSEPEPQEDSAAKKQHVNPGNYFETT